MKNFVIGILCVGMLIILTIFSISFLEPYEKSKKEDTDEYIQNIQQSDRFMIDYFEDFYVVTDVVTDVETGLQYITKYNKSCPFTLLETNRSEVRLDVQ